MKENKINVDLTDKSYDVFIRKDILSDSGKYLSNLNISKKILLVTQNKIPKIFTNKVKQSLHKAGFRVFLLVLPSGEKYKNLDSLLKIVNFAIKNKFERNDSFCALGGGVVSDLTGFAASIYYRGNNFICMPTTLLAMVDAAVGGKTSINIREGKNLLGTFYQPKIILIDPNCISTLPKREFLVGMGEVIKYALLENTAKSRFSKKGFFHFLLKNKKNILRNDPISILKIIIHSVTVKAKVVSKDEKESNLRAILNLGHTFAHGIEQAYNYTKYTHGEAVSLGMCMASKLAYNHGFITERGIKSIIGLIASYNLPTKLDSLSKVDQILKSMLLDKKAKDGKLRFILPNKRLGSVKIVSDITLEEVKSVLRSS